MNNNLSFAANIRFVPNAEFDKVTNHISRERVSPQFIDKPWNKAIFSQEDALTTNATYCICGGLTNNSKDVVMFHYKPDMVGAFNKVKNEVYEESDKLCQPVEQLSGLITGGYEYKLPLRKHEIDYSHLSRSLTDKFREEFQKAKIAFSEFTGQKRELTGHTNIFYRKEDDTWFINYRENKKDPITEKIVDDPTAAVENPVDFLKSVYNKIHVCENDEVFVNNKPVDKNLLNNSCR